MKKILILITLLIVSYGNTFAQDNFQPNTGDGGLDNELTEINRKAKQDLNRFKEDIKNTFGINRERVEKIMNTYKMEPADVIMASRIAKIIKKEPEVVSESFSKNREKGWGAIAKELGIKPGSAEFHELKNAGKNKGNSNGKGNSKDKENKIEKEKGGSKGKDGSKAKKK